MTQIETSDRGYAAHSGIHALYKLPSEEALSTKIIIQSRRCHECHGVLSVTIQYSLCDSDFDGLPALSGRITRSSPVKRRVAGEPCLASWNFGERGYSPGLFRHVDHCRCVYELFDRGITWLGEKLDTRNAVTELPLSLFPVLPWKIRIHARFPDCVLRSAALSSVQSEWRWLHRTGRRAAWRATPAVQREVRRAVEGGLTESEYSAVSPHRLRCLSFFFFPFLSKRRSVLKCFHPIKTANNSPPSEIVSYRNSRRWWWWWWWWNWWCKGAATSLWSGYGFLSSAAAVV